MNGRLLLVPLVLAVAFQVTGLATAAGPEASETKKQSEKGKKKAEKNKQKSEKGKKKDEQAKKKKAKKKTGDEAQFDPNTLPPPKDPVVPNPPMCHEPRTIPDSRFDCTGVDGILDRNVTIGPDADDPSVLSGIREVSGSLVITQLSGTNLDFMACLEVVGSNLTIFQNDSLTNVDGLYNLKSIGGSTFVFTQNGAVTEFDGPPNLPGSSTLNLIVNNNAQLTRISGFHSLVQLHNLTVRDNPVLTNIDGLGRLQAIAGDLAVTANANLCMSSVQCVLDGLVFPATPPDDWTTHVNANGC